MDPNFTLEQIMQLQLQKYKEQISEIAYKATLEFNIENVTFIDLFFNDLFNNISLTIITNI